MSVISTDTVPDSIFERSRMSLMRPSRSVPAELIVRANSTCFSFRLPCWLVARRLEEDQQRIERRPAAHGSCWPGTRTCIWRSSGKLFSLLFQSTARHLDFEVLVLDLLLSRFREAGPSPAVPRSWCEALPASWSVPSGGLELGGQQLRLAEQALGAHRRRDRVQDDADRFHQAG